MLIIAVVFGVASAVVYGAATVVQHQTAQQTSDGDRVSVSGLWSMLRRPAFLFAVVGDGLGFGLQVIALSAGPVVVIQPLVVLMLPVSLAVSFAWTRRRPATGDYLGVLGVLGGLSVFLLSIGAPSSGHVPEPRIMTIAIATIVVTGAAGAGAVHRGSPKARAAVYGAAAGAFFGGLAVMVDTASSWTSTDGYEGLLESARGLVPLAGIAVLGIGGMILTQLSFQIGELGATLPANLAVDPLVAVLLGIVLLHERVPISAPRIAVYAICLAAVLAGAIRLANPAHEPVPHADEVSVRG